MLTILLLLSLLTAPLAVPAAPQEYPVPREKAVIVETDTTYRVWDSANPFIPRGTQWGSGWHQVVEEWDWYINYATGEVIYWRIKGWDYSADYMTFMLHVREGVTWNDGEPYTAHDIVFTLNMLSLFTISEVGIINLFLLNPSHNPFFHFELTHFCEGQVEVVS